MCVRLVTIFDKHEAFIRLQYDSIIKHVKCQYEYIVFNNASTEEQAIINQQVCTDLGIKCLRIKADYTKSPSEISGEALNESFKYLRGQKVFKIDSDMYLIVVIWLMSLIISRIKK